MRRERVRFTSVHCRKKLPLIFSLNYRFSLSPSLPCNFLLFLQCFQRPWKIRILQKFSLCEEEETRGINSGLTRVDGNPEESHWRCSHPTYLACVCVWRAHTESREPAEETEDLSRRQFGLTDLILLSLLLVSSLPRSSPLSLRQFSSFSFSPASILSSGENSREANALLHSNCRLIFILTSYFARDFKYFRFENLRTRFSSNGARQNLVNSKCTRVSRMFTRLRADVANSRNVCH